MTTPNRPVPPPVHAIWKTFVTTASGKDPEKTITSFDLRAEAITKALAPPAPTPPVSVSELPSVPVVVTASPQNEPVATDFEVRGVLGEGGMGRVLLARQKSLQRDVALKVLKGDDGRRDVIATLLAEAVITGSIEHPSIVPVHALGRDKNGLPVLVMKRIDGVSWKKLFVDPNHPVWASLAVDAADRLDSHLEILMSVCNAAYYAHSRGIVHRDIKLDNIMIGGFGEVYLVDWGIAIRLSEAKEHRSNQEDFEAPVGTLAYMAPEMAMGDIAHIGPWTDVYLLGATLHYLLTGKPRHRGESPYELLLSARDSEPYEYDSAISTELAAICHKAMHVDPEKRFSSALELRQALAAYRRHRGSLALSAKAFAKMAEMENAKKVDERRMLQEMTECRFAFMQALEAWAGNEPARQGLDKVLEKMIHYEMGRRDVEGARALLGQLSVERPDLLKKIEELAADVAREHADAARLQALARDADIRIGARAQLLVVAILPLSAILSLVVVQLTDSSELFMTRQLIGFPIAMLMILAVAYFAVRKRLTTSISRRAFATLVIYPCSLLVHRIFAMTQGDTVASMLMTDLVYSALMALIYAIMIVPRLAWMCPIFLLGAMGIATFPARATMIFLITANAVASLLTLLWLSMMKNEKN